MTNARSTASMARYLSEGKTGIQMSKMCMWEEKAGRRSHSWMRSTTNPV